MKYATAFVSLLLSYFATFKTVSSSRSDQTVLNDEFVVPGDNPLIFCQSPENYILTINHVNLSPNPPSPGKKLTIEAKGNFTQAVCEGATTDLCEQMKQVDEECPLGGEKALTKEVDIPHTIPPGTYSVTADVYTKDAEKITCLKATKARAE